VNEHGRDIEL